jgi:hypothetical protein
VQADDVVSSEALSVRRDRLTRARSDVSRGELK